MVAATAPWEAGANASNCSAAWMRPEQDAPSSKGRVHQHITELCPRLSELSRYHPRDTDGTAWSHRAWSTTCKCNDIYRYTYFNCYHCKYSVHYSLR